MYMYVKYLELIKFLLRKFDAHYESVDMHALIEYLFTAKQTFLRVER